MTGDVAFRTYEGNDGEAVVTLAEWALRDAGTDPADVPGSDDVRDVQSSYLDAGGAFVVGTVEGGYARGLSESQREQLSVGGRLLVVMGGFLPGEVGYDDERTAEGAVELHRMRVAPTHQRLGYGRALLVELETRARREGFETVLATTTRRQEAGVGLYRRAGYDLVETSTRGEYDMVHFEKTLD